MPALTRAGVSKVAIDDEELEPGPLLAKVSIFRPSSRDVAMASDSLARSES